MKRKRVDKVNVNYKRMLSNNIFAAKLLFESTPIYGISIIVEAIRHNLINFLSRLCVYIMYYMQLKTREVFLMS